MKSKEFMKLIKDPRMARAYLQLLKELKCEPSEVAKKLREKVWKGKNSKEVLEELEKW